MIRIKIASFTVILVFSFLFLSLFSLQVLRGKEFRDLSNKNSIRLLPQEASRGKILDRQGNTIVDNKLSFNLMILPQQSSQVDIDKVLTGVSQILDTGVEGLKDKFKSSAITQFVPISIAWNIDVKEAMRLEELKPDLPGIFMQPQPQRVYPYGRLASHAIGYLNEIDRWRITKLKDFGYKTKDIVGFGGVEEKYDYYLRQEEGGLLVEVDHRGRFVRALGFKPPKSGKSIQLTLDLNLQKIVEANLEGKTGSVILMDPYSGQILAMASFPNFNPSVFVKKSTSSIYNLLNDYDAPLINRAISATYPAGSVFKLILATAALETGKINLSKTFSCSGSILIGRQEYACWNTHNQQNLIGAITRSCNVFFFKTGLLVGAQTLHDYALKFNLSRVTTIDLPYEASGFVPSPLWRKIYKFKNWFDGDTANLSIGQGELLVTPLQIARMMAVFANRGYLVTPYIVKAIDGRDISVYRKKFTRLAIKESTLDYIRQGLRNVVSDPSGTANILSTLSVHIAGKTGTAQAPPGQPHGWFVGFFPFKNPKFVICVFLEHAGSGYHATVLTKQIIEAMIKAGLI